MPMNWNHSLKQVDFYCMTQKIFFEEVVRPQRRWFRIFQLNICCRIRKTISEKKLTLASPCWIASFQKRTFFQGSVSWKIVYTSKLISQFHAIVCMSVKSICYELFLRRIKLRKTVFWNCHFVFTILRKRSLSEKLYFREVTTKDGVSISGRQKCQKIAFFLQQILVNNRWI